MRASKLAVQKVECYFANWYAALQNLPDHIYVNAYVRSNKY